MNIREAEYADASILRRIQEQCIAGTQIMVTTVNDPDFFLRSRMYMNSLTYVITDHGSPIGTCSLAIKDAKFGSEVIKQGYIYQLFTDPKYMRKGMAAQLLNHVEEIMLEKNVDLATALIMEGNIPSMRCFESAGYHRERIFANPYISAYKNLRAENRDHYFTTLEDQYLEDVCKLLNTMWHENDLYMEYTIGSLRDEIKRVSGIDYKDIMLLWHRGKLCACAALWDWSSITKVTVVKLSTKYKALSLLLNTFGHVFLLPRMVKIGEQMKQACLYFYAYTDIQYFSSLMKKINNYARSKGLNEFCFLCSQSDKVLNELKQFIWLNVNSQLYVKKINKKLGDFSKEVWINGGDI